MASEAQPVIGTSALPTQDARPAPRPSAVPAIQPPAPRQVDGLADVLRAGMLEAVFPDHLELVPQINELYEMELAYLESRLLTEEEIIRQAGYFARVRETFTRHYLMCSGKPLRLPEHSSSRLRSFFQTNQFRTGYGTHGLFPYRGKFHPQMIKGLINAIGLKPGETVLDPMMGSGTVLIEARLMGINSVGIDPSPFCRMMVQGKLDGLTLPLAPLKLALADARSVFEHFRALKGDPTPGRKLRKRNGTKSMFVSEQAPLYFTVPSDGKLPKGCKDPAVYNFLLLSYLDAAGYAERSTRKPPFEQFKAILERYVFVVEKIQNVLSGIESEMGEARALEGDARKIPLNDSSVHGIIFSPPYSFAIDYLDNDEFHLSYLGVDMEKLREGMIGLRGNSLREKYDLYKEDMNSVLSESARVLVPGRICAIVVGTNNNQLSEILEVSPDEVTGLDETLADLGGHHGLKLVRKMHRQISGMANTMRTEFIVMLQKQ